MDQDPRAQQAMQQRIRATAPKRKEVLKRYGERAWLHVAPPEQVFERMRRKGMNQEAQELVRQMPRLREVRSVDAEAERPELAEPGVVPESLGPTEEAPEDLGALGRRIFETVIGDEDISPARFVHRASAAARAVGRIVFASSRRPNGTGFLVAPGLLLTNHHVISSVADAAANLLQLGYAEPERGAPIRPVEFRFAPERLLLTSLVDDLDYALVAVEPESADGRRLDAFGWLPLIAETGKAVQGERMNIIHHPSGRPQQISLRENFLALKLERYLHYMTDTMRGSSGSPVFNDEWEVVALHHAAVEITDDEEVELYRDALGSSVPRGMDADAETLVVNEGARVSRILASLRSPTESVGEPALLRGLFDARRPETDEGVGSPAPPVVVPGSRTGTLRIEPDGSATWTVALTKPIPLVAATGPSHPLSGEEARRLELFVNQVNSQKSVLRALSFLQERREGAYLPEPGEMAAVVAAYYGDLPDRVAAGQVAPADLFDELSPLVGDLRIATTFPESVADLESLRPPGLESMRILESDTMYARSRAHLYTWVDLHPNRMLRGVYTHTIIAPEQLMLRDVLTQLDLDDLLPRRFRNNQYLNCEHIVPQSWFHEASVPRADLHHLSTADGQANNFRSNSPYRTLGAAGAEGPDGRPSYVPAAGRKTDDGFFEPARGKGLVARATLYFLLAYAGELDATRYDANEIETLKDWAREEPPDEHERHRNHGAFEVQGNRNPLIDFPAWIDAIDFRRGLA